MKTQPLSYRQAVVTFLDIMGFGDLVKTADAPKIKGVLDIVARFTKGDLHDFDAFGPTTIAFSDSIVRIRYIDGKNAEYPMGHVCDEVIDMIHAQGELIKHDIVLRGGITSGHIYFDGTTVFGPALVRAYELESKAALYPRVVVDPITLNAMKTDKRLGYYHHTRDTDRRYLRNLLRRGENGRWFVDYLWAIVGELDDPDLEIEVLKDHKQLVLNRLKDSKIRLAALDKILWLATYHNRRIASLPNKWFSHFGVSRTELRITTNELPELAILPKKGTT